MTHDVPSRDSHNPITSTGIDRAAFMERVRNALGPAERDTDPHTHPHPKPPNVDETIARLAGLEQNLADLFAGKAQEVGMTVHRAHADEAASRLASLLVELEIRSVTLCLSKTESAAALTQAVRDTGCDIVDWRDSPNLDAHYDVDAGITDVDAALAESGTLIVSSDPHHSRGAFLVPPIHIAIVAAADILPDMIDYFSEREAPAHHTPPTATVFITGPSKTADIEGILITGVHGPKQVHILLIDTPPLP
ncbi:MAG: lactate utilization protein [Phycisphaerales bacterium]|nr:lactate utilization protein [Phycisphaerales bacterium]